MKSSRVIAMLLVIVMASMLFFSACQSNGAAETAKTGGEANTSGSTQKESVEPVEFSVYIGDAKEDYPGSTIVGDIIKKETGVSLKWEYLVGDLKTKIGVMIAGGEYPDFLNARGSSQQVIDAGGLIPLNNLIDQYGPNIKKMLGTWINRLKDKDGNIYMIPQIVPYGDVTVVQPHVAFWIQRDVLKKANFPKVKTLDKYFELIQNYKKDNPKLYDKDTIGFEVLFDSWRFFCATSPPTYLTGHPNDGSFDVDRDGNGGFTLKPYKDQSVAKYYYQTLNAMYNKGLVDTETFTMNFDQYIEKLSSGRVLGMFDQPWQFEPAQKVLKLEKPDRAYVGLPIVMDDTVKDQYVEPKSLQVTEGMGITKDCKDPVRAIKFLDYLSSQDTQKLLRWGVKGQNYLVDEKGRFYRTQEMRDAAKQADFANRMGAKWFLDMWPSMIGTYDDGNADSPDRQPEEIYGGYYDDGDRTILDGYGIKLFTELFNKPEEGRKYFPLWSIALPTGGEAEIQNQKSEEVSREFIPKLVMCKPDAFEAVWKDYVDKFNKVGYDKVMKYYQEEINRRMKEW